MRSSRDSRRARCRRQRTYRGPLSMLWLALMAVATGPAACFVVPSSTRLRGGGGCFAAASTLPKVVLGTRQGSRGARGAARNDPRGDSSDRPTVYAVVARGGINMGLAAHTRQQRPQLSTQKERSEDPSRHGQFATVTAISAGKGIRVAPTALTASSAGVDVKPGVADGRRKESRAKRILILMSDTGGGHRASSEALSAALKDLYGDQVRHFFRGGLILFDVWGVVGPYVPYSFVKLQG